MGNRAEDSVRPKLAHGRTGSSSSGARARLPSRRSSVVAIVGQPATYRLPHTVQLCGKIADLIAETRELPPQTRQSYPEKLVIPNLIESGYNLAAALAQLFYAAPQILHPFARLRGLFRERAAYLGDDLGHSARILGSQRDGLAVVMQYAFGNRRRNGAVDYRRNARHVRKLEIRGPELIQQADDAVGFGAAHP